MKTKLLILFCVVPSIVRSISDSVETTGISINPSPQIIPAEKYIQNDKLIGDYIEYQEGDNVSFLCHGPDLVYLLPNLTEYQKHDDEDFLKRVTIQNGLYNSTLFIENAQITDTGRYGCSSSTNSSFAHNVYIFVRSKDNKIFLPTIASTYEDQNNVVVPCKTSIYTNSSNVELWDFQGELEGDNISYDPRIGFLVSKERLIEKQMWLHCKYTDKSSDYEEWASIMNTRFNSRSNSVLWEEPGEWNYMGMNLNLTCYAQLDTDVVDIQMNCPRCKKMVKLSPTDLKEQANGKTPFKYHQLTAIIENATLEDAGVYECIVQARGFYKKDTVNLTFSRTMGRVKVNYRTRREDVTIHEGEDLLIQVNFTHYPFGFKNYNATWKRILKVGKEKNDVVYESFKNGTKLVEYSDNLAYAELSLQGVQTNQSGVYVLVIEIADLKESVGFIVRIKNKKPAVQLTVPTPTNYTSGDRKFYPPKTNIEVFCKIEAYPEIDNRRLNYRNTSGPWEKVPEDEVKITKMLVYGTLIHWHTVLNQSLEVACLVDRKNVKSSDTVKIETTGEESAVKVEHRRSLDAFDNENKNEIYEGDHLYLRCIYPKYLNMLATWRSNGTAVPKDNIISNSDDFSWIYTLIIWTVSPVHNRTTYRCDLVNVEDQTLLTRYASFNVVKTEKPFLISSYYDSVVEWPYGEPASLSCPLTGTPKPKIEWYKEDELLDNTNNSETLNLERVTWKDDGVFKCKATNRKGSTDVNITAKVVDAASKLNLIGGIAAASILFLLTVVLFTYKYFKDTKPERELKSLHARLMEQHGPLTIEDMYSCDQAIRLDQKVQNLNYNRRYDLDKELIAVGGEIGCGEFGVVKKGILTKGCGTDKIEKCVAIKQAKDGFNTRQQKMLVDELLLMGALGIHPNVVALLGAVTKEMSSGRLLVIIEYCQFGMLKDYIALRRDVFKNELRCQNDGYIVSDAREPPPERGDYLSDISSLSTSDLLCFAMQIANGMSYLASIPCVHRDLALRNILLADRHTIRIGDFGLARKYDMDKTYYRLRKSKHPELPYRWMSIEANEQDLYTVASDVWSYGIVLYELFSLAGQPYPDWESDDRHDLLQKLKNGYRNPKPQYCPSEIFDLMSQCWEENASRRPNFNRCFELMWMHLGYCNRKLLLQIEAEIIIQADKQKAAVEWACQEELPSQRNSTEDEHKNENRALIK